MRISLAEAKGQWPELVRRAGAGDEIVLKARSSRPLYIGNDVARTDIAALPV